MKKLSIVLLLSVLFCGCRTKVYWLPGTLETNGVAAHCTELSVLSNTLALRSKVNRLVKQSLKEEDPEKLVLIAREISRLTQALKMVLAPEYSVATYPVVYRFKIKKSFIPQGAQLFHSDFSLMGERVFGKDLRIEEEASTIDITLQRPATLLEICALSGTAQGLFGVGTHAEHPDFYYRLYVEDLN